MQLKPDGARRRRERRNVGLCADAAGEEWRGVVLNYM